MPFHRRTKTFLRARLVAADRQRRLRQFGLDHGRSNRFLRVERREPPRQIFQFAHIARPAMMLEALKPGLIDLFRRQALALRLGKEMSDQVGYVLDALAQWR